MGFECKKCGVRTSGRSTMQRHLDKKHGVTKKKDQDKFIIRLE